MTKTTRFSSLLVKLGLRTKCCHAKEYTPKGWLRGYCSGCNKRVW